MVEIELLAGPHHGRTVAVPVDQHGRPAPLLEFALLFLMPDSGHLVPLCTDYYRVDPAARTARWAHRVLAHQPSAARRSLAVPRPR